MSCLGCETTPPDAAERSVPRTHTARGACRQLADDFQLIAEHREQGASKQGQIQHARQALGGGNEIGERNREQALAARLHIIDLVYRLPAEMGAAEVGAFVEEHCALDEHGAAVLRAPRPTGSAPPG